MKKEVLISIKGTQKTDGDQDSIELTTTGSLYHKNGCYYISYQESEATGFAGCHTTLKIENQDRVTMLRSGSHESQLIVERGQRHQCCYGSEYGPMTIGVTGDRIINEITENGGRLRFRYSLDINSTLASENEVTINIKECNN